jgi:hypothetical protein
VNISDLEKSSDKIQKIPNIPSIYRPERFFEAVSLDDHQEEGPGIRREGCGCDARKIVVLPFDVISLLE